jgi:L-ascorbate metabolism protein UlaG (beta-lactamase superfamily)
MKITKLNHSCLLVEMPEPVNRTALFDPGVFSEEFVDVDALKWLDDIIITHSHNDHFSATLVQKLAAKFPEVRITAPPDVVQQLEAMNIKASSEPSNGIVLFEAPHAAGEPLFAAPEQRAVHYLDMLTHPGDSHTFSETKPVLALPMQAPWGSTLDAINLAIKLKPRYILPIHDWHWSDAARAQMYQKFERILSSQGINFISLENSSPVVLDI